MKEFSRLWVTCLVVALSMPFAVCRVEADEIAVGTTLTLSGAYASYGQQALHGIELAIEEVNARGGVGGKQVRLVVEDTGTYDSKRAVIAARKMIDVDKVALFLPLIIEDSEFVVPITTKVPLFSMVVGCGARTCGFNLGPYNVRAPSSHDGIIERLVAYSKQKAIKHACVVAAQATYFSGYGRLIEELSKTAGQNVTYVEVPLSNTDDQRSVAARFKAEQCDAIYTWIPMGAVGSFFRRIREAGSAAQIFSIVETDDPTVLQAAGAASEGVVFARFDHGSDQFRARYEKRFGPPLLRPAVPAYDGVKLLLELADKVGTDPKALREAFLAVKDRPAENGTITYTPEGERLGERVELLKIVDGKPVLLPE